MLLVEYQHRLWYRLFKIQVKGCSVRPTTNGTEPADLDRQRWPQVSSHANLGTIPASRSSSGIQISSQWFREDPSLTVELRKICADRPRDERYYLASKIELPYLHRGGRDWGYRVLIDVREYWGAMGQPFGVRSVSEEVSKSSERMTMLFGHSFWVVNECVTFPLLIIHAVRDPSERAVNKWWI